MVAVARGGVTESHYGGLFTSGKEVSLFRMILLRGKKKVSKFRNWVV